MSLRPFRKFDLDYIQYLVNNKVREHDHLQYEAKLDIDTEAGQYKLLADVEAIANSGGGNIIYGVKKSTKTSELYKICGLPEFNFDEVLARIRDILESRIIPKIHNLEIGVLRKSEAISVIVLHVPLSLSTPHRIAGERRSPYVRKGNLIREMTPGERRESEGFHAKIDSIVFQRACKRMAKILSDKGSISPGHASKVIVFLYPVATILGTAQIEVKDLPGYAHTDMIFGCLSYCSRLNAKGWLKYHEDADGSGGAYVQYFHNGAVEAVIATTMVATQGEAKKDSIQTSIGEKVRLGEAKLGIEQAIVYEVNNGLEVLNAMGLDFPIYVVFAIGSSETFPLMDYSDQLFDRRFFISPLIQKAQECIYGGIMEAAPENLARSLRPEFDRMWRNLGRALSTNSDAGGK